jgi:hypothetical protein
VTHFLSAYAEAERLLGGQQLRELTAGQLAQLRAIDVAHQRRLFALVRADGQPREPTERELAALRERIAADIRAILTPEQRRAPG